MEATTTDEAPKASETTGEGATLDRAKSVAQRLTKRLAAAIRGRDEVIELVLTALLADGHVLLEDYPGSGKTTLARALGAAVTGGGDAIASFRRRLLAARSEGLLVALQEFDAKLRIPVAGLGQP